MPTPQAPTTLPTLVNVIDPPPRLTGDAKQDLVAIVQWLNAFYVKGIIQGGLLQQPNFNGQMDQTMLTIYPTLDSLAGQASAPDKLPYFSDKDTFSLTDLSPYMRTLLAAVDEPAAHVVLGIP